MACPSVRCRVLRKLEQSICSRVLLTITTARFLFALDKNVHDVRQAP